MQQKRGMSGFPLKLFHIIAGPHHSVVHRDRRRQSRLLSLILITIIILGLVMFFGDMAYADFVFPSHNSLVSITAVVLLITSYFLNRFGYYRAGTISTICIITAGYVGAVITGMFLFDAFVPGLPPGEVPTITTVMIGGLALLAAGHRSRVEKDRLTELTVSEERFRRVVQNAQEGFIVIDDETNRVLNVNEEACRLFGLTAEECRNRGWREIAAQIARPRDDAPNKCV